MVVCFSYKHHKTQHTSKWVNTYTHMHTLTLLLPAPPAAGPTAIVRAEALPVDACMLVFAAAAANKTSLNMDLQQLYPLRVSLSHETVSTHFTPFKRWFVIKILFADYCVCR